MSRGGFGASEAGTGSPAPQPSRRLSLVPRRLDIWATPGRAGAAAARVLYQPRHRGRIAGGAVARVLPALSRQDLPLPHPQLIVGELAELVGVEAPAAAALHVRGTDRWLYALMGPEGGGVVVKAGKAGDERLEREASMLAALASSETTLQVPVLRWYGERDGWFALVTDIVKRVADAGSTGIEGALAAAYSLATMDGGFVVHGDLAPWNMVPSPHGLALVDWEKSRFEFDPLCDLAHYVIRTGALLHRWRPRAAVTHLVGSESIGRRYLRDIGVDPDSAAEHLMRYLNRPTLRSAGSSNVRRYELEMVEILNSNPAWAAGGGGTRHHRP